MDSTTYIGIDNGVTGSIGVVGWGITVPIMIKTPIISQQSYTKKKQNISRLNVIEFKNFLEHIIYDIIGRNTQMFAVIERPMINSVRFKASISAARCLEAQLCILESYKIAYRYIDSKEWQRYLLPKGLKKEELKKASLDIGIRTFPHLDKIIHKQKDADGILIAEYARLNNL